MSDLEGAARVILAEAARSGVGIALIGGFAVSVRTQPRFTRDIDLVVAVEDDEQAEAFVRSLLAEGHELLAGVEQDATHRFANVRLHLRGGQLVDLLFASSGIEREIVDEAELVEVLPGLVLPVITTGHLIALKVLARDDASRPQDVADLRQLLAVATPAALVTARSAVELICERGFDRGRDLQADLDEVIRTCSPGN